VSISLAAQTLYTTMVSAGYEVSVGLRRAGNSTPCIVYEVTQVDFEVAMTGKVIPHYTMQVTADCVADTALEAWTVVDDLLATFTGNIDNAVDDIMLVLVAVNASARTETPDDGQSDAERVVSLVMTILAKAY
jgi:hypothetical protein